MYCLYQSLLIFSTTFFLTASLSDEIESSKGHKETHVFLSTMNSISSKVASDNIILSFIFFSPSNYNYYFVISSFLVELSCPIAEQGCWSIPQQPPGVLYSASVIR